MQLRESLSGKPITMQHGCPPSRKPSQAFTLIELIAVLVIMALMASLATISIRGGIARQRIARGVEIVERFDSALRRDARRRRARSVGVIRTDEGTLSVLAAGRETKSFQLPGRVEITSIKPIAGGRIVTGPDGRTESYAVRIESAGAGIWVFLAGGTGQSIHLTDSADVDRLLRRR